MRCVLITVLLLLVPCVLLVIALGSPAGDNGDGEITAAINGSCYNRCGDEPGPQQCLCDVSCTAETCCSDYESVCWSCSNRCTDSVHADAPCQCDSRCGDDDPPPDDCCADYDALCNSVTSVGNVTDEELKLLTEELWALDGNNGAFYITVNLQGQTTSADTDDVAPMPLFTTVEQEAFTPVTIQLYEALRDNYFLQVAEEEIVTDEETVELVAFLDTVMSTSVMTRLEEFFLEHDILNGTLRENLEQIWFTLYSRSGTVMDSSGFEHVFIGELDGGTVGGFHNWISFYREEAAGQLDYAGHIEESDLGQAGYVLTNRFTWHNTSKPIGGGLVGPSPEFELALYSVCFFVRPNSICSVQVNGVPFDVQTYDYDGQQLVGSAYPIVVNS